MAQVAHEDYYAGLLLADTGRRDGWPRVQAFKTTRVGQFLVVVERRRESGPEPGSTLYGAVANADEVLDVVRKRGSAVSLEAVQGPFRQLHLPDGVEWTPAALRKAFDTDGKPSLDFEGEVLESMIRNRDGDGEAVRLVDLVRKALSHHKPPLGF